MSIGLRHPLPNVTYKVDDYACFHTDDLGRTDHVHVEDLQLRRDTRASAAANRNVAGGQPAVDAGHLLAGEFGGAREEINLVQMVRDLNRGWGGAHYVRDLELCPRPPELVPGWMDVELAAVGGLGPAGGPAVRRADVEGLRADGCAADAGVAGAATAGCVVGVAHEPAPVDSGPIRGQVTYRGAGTRPGRHPVGTERSRVRDERGGMVPPWNEPRSVVPPEAMLPLRERWEQLASRHGPLVRVLEPDAGLVPGEESVGIAPALAAVVEALPGVALGPIVVDWPQGASQTWPQLEDRHSYQPMWVDGREAVVVRVDPESGQAGEVLHVRDDLGLDVLAGDVVVWWKALTAWAEERVPTLKEYAEPQAIDEEDLEMMLQEALEQEFADWLESAA